MPSLASTGSSASGRSETSARSSHGAWETTRALISGPVADLGLDRGLAGDDVRVGEHEALLGVDDDARAAAGERRLAAAVEARAARGRDSTVDGEPFLICCATVSVFGSIGLLTALPSSPVATGGGERDGDAGDRECREDAAADERAARDRSRRDGGLLGRAAGVTGTASGVRGVSWAGGRGRTASAARSGRAGRARSSFVWPTSTTSPGLQPPARRDALVVDVGAVGRAEVLDLDAPVGRGMDARVAAAELGSSARRPLSSSASRPIRNSPAPMTISRPLALPSVTRSLCVSVGVMDGVLWARRAAL